MTQTSVFPWFVAGLIILGFSQCSDPRSEPPSSAESDWYQINFGINDSVVISAYAQGDPGNLTLRNYGENINLETLENGSYRIPVFGGLFQGKWNDKGVFNGRWLDKTKEPFEQTALTIQPGAPPLCLKKTPLVPDEIYGLTFTKEGSPSWYGQLVVKKDGESALATVRTDTGDLRYFGGTKDADDSYRIQTFDGAHLYRMDLTFDDDIVNGFFHSSSGYKATISGKRLGKMPLIDPLRIKATGPLDFTVVVDRDSTVERWTAERFQGTVTLIDLMGTWCPNCMDEARMLKDLKSEFPKIQIASVAFERKPNPRSVFEKFNQYQEDLGVDWPIVYGGPAKKKETSYKMHFLSGFESFPTTLILNPAGEIIYVHSGFNGPATGEAYEKEKQFFRAAIRSLGG